MAFGVVAKRNDSELEIWYFDQLACLSIELTKNGILSILSNKFIITIEKLFSSRVSQSPDEKWCILPS